MGAAPFEATLSADGKRVSFAVGAPTATRLEVWAYLAPLDAASHFQAVMLRDDDGTFNLDVDMATLRLAPTETVYYGYRAWGPNWPYAASWKPGQADGFLAEVDLDGNRFNPNKLLLDPYALEVSHCVQTPAYPDRAAYGSGPANYLVDTGPFAPKGIVLSLPGADVGPRPTHPFKDDIIYEVHLRGLTKADPTMTPDLQGTYAGAALRADYLRDLGITAVEFLPIHQTQNALNDLAAFPDAHNYWGYDSISYFAPDRRYARDQSPGGPTREWQAMVKAFHQAGLKVFVDVVYNHLDEAQSQGATDTIYSLRGLDNRGYYETLGQFGAANRYQDDNGVGPNINAATDNVRDLVLASLRYWSGTLGVDGFRFDLAAVLGNEKAEGGYSFDATDPDGILARAVRELPARPALGGDGIDLIAEPYTADGSGQEQGKFPLGWSEWNDRFRDAMRASQNKLGILPITAGELATRFAGSADLFSAGGRKPWNAVNYIVCHDGFTLRDLHSYAQKQNNQPYPFGPSLGGRSSEDEMCWDHGGDAAEQAQAIRTSVALLLVSAGVPMLTGGTEMNRTQYGNNNPYNLDTVANWLDWSRLESESRLVAYVKALIALRHRHPALRPASFFTGKVGPSGIKDLTWLKADGVEIDTPYFTDPNNHYIGFQIDGSLFADPAPRLLVAYNFGSTPVLLSLPVLPAGQAWFEIADSSQDRVPTAEDVPAMDNSNLSARCLRILVAHE